MPTRLLTSELQQKAESELNEVPSKVEEDLTNIKKWLIKQPHINARMDDQWLLSFLRGCKFSFQRTKEKLDMYYTVKTFAPELFADRDPFLPDIQQMLKQGAYVILPETADKAGPKIILSRGERADPDKVNLATAMKVLLMMFEILYMEDDNFTIAGNYIVISLNDFSFKYTTQLTSTFLKKVFMCLQDVYPIRSKGIFWMNAPSFFTTVYNAIEMFLTEKNRSRIKFFGQDDQDELYKIVPRRILPKEFGGEGPSCDEITAEWKIKVESYRDWFLEDAQYRTDETKRPGKPKTSEDIFGVDGSLRKLEVD